MPAELSLGMPLLYGFLLVLARVSGVCALVPLPGMQASPALARIVLSVVLTFALVPRWPQPENVPASPARLLFWVLPEAAVGVAIGLAVSFLLEAFVLAAQIISLNAGFSFASTIDPATQAESGVLVVFAQLASGLVFLSLGLHRQVIRTLAQSLDAYPAGAWLTPRAADGMIRLSADMLSLALRLALPAVALLVLTDVALGLLGRLNAQLQLLTLSFPIKMMGTLILLGWIMALLPKLLAAYAARAFGTLGQVLRF